MHRIFLFWLLTLTASARPPLAVPFIAQQPGDCGPAALAMVANYYGQPVGPDAIAKAIYLPAIHGTLTADLASYAGRFNFWVRQYHGTPSDLRQKLAAGVPVIVLGKFGSHLHFFVVLGLDEFAGTVQVHSDQQAGLVMPQEQFWHVWDRADRWALLVCPPERATWQLTGNENNDLGVFLEQTGQLSAAAGTYRRAMELVPTNSYFQMNLGNALLKQNLLTEAVAAFRQAVRSDPENADALNNLAWTYGELQANLDEALGLCARAIQLQPGRRAFYLDTRGRVLDRQGKRSAALEAWEQALAATSDRQTGLRATIREHLAQLPAGQTNESRPNSQKRVE